jgi:3-deoxy-manno-octulosonate cytidylyltransferase (CMP-KDO synthetase)
MSFHVIIPARLASTRLPDKPLADIAGKPMVVRVAERAQLSGAQKVIVATDDISIVNACRQYHIEAVMTLKTHPSGTDRIAEVTKKLQWPADAVVVNVQGDEPLIEPELIAATAKKISNTIFMATAATRLENVEEMFNPHIVKVVLDRENRALYFSRAPIPWDRTGFSGEKKEVSAGFAAYRHIGIYAFRNDFLLKYASLPVSPVEEIEALEQLRALWHGYPVSVHISASIPMAGVDTQEDLERVRQYFVS